MVASGVACLGWSVLALCSSYTNTSRTSMQLGPWPIETVLHTDMSIEINVPNLPIAERQFCNISLKDVDGSEADQIRQDFGE